jgi:branched-chain amino acid aminotransferase
VCGAPTLCDERKPAVPLVTALSGSIECITEEGVRGMPQLVYMNGRLVPAEEAKVSVWDHGFLYGDGVFEGIRAYNGRVFKLDAHLRRLFDSAKGIGLDIGMSQDALAAAVLDTVAANGLQDAYIRLVVSRGTGDLGLDPKNCPAPTVIIIASSIQLYPEALYEHGLSLVTASVRRAPPDVLNPGLKTLNYLTGILAKMEAQKSGAPEVLILNHQGFVAECSGDNIFIVRDGVLLTPPPWVGILNGITRQTVIELATADNVPVREEVLTLADVYRSDECFLTGTAAEVIAAVEVDGRRIGDGHPGPITRRLTSLFRQYAQSHGTPVPHGQGPHRIPV